MPCRASSRPPASTEASTATAPATRVAAPTTAAFAVSTRHRRGVAASVSADHPGAVLAADHGHGHDRDDGLAQVDPGEADLGRVDLAGRPGRAGHRVRREPRPPPRSARPRPAAASRCRAGCAAWSTPRAPRPSCVPPAEQEQREGQGERRPRRTAPRTRPTGPAGSSPCQACRRSLTWGYCVRLCWTANAAAGVTRSSHCSAPTGRMPGTVASRYGSTMPAITAVTAPALRRSSVPTASPSTAETASSAAVPTTTCSQVSAGDRRDRVAVLVQQVLAERDRDRGRDQPGRERDRGQHDGLGGQHPAAARAGGERGADQAAPVLRGDEHDADHHHGDQARRTSPRASA